ncbi:MAG: exonuclease SbcCD subunit D C-terminal domain-containing protein [Methylobacter sp.]|nr:exonuclease SbcCD subunit D C-terminal domain-containing protein [Methylobacter sp.]MDP2100141.1 exonuclease SbcCD subunit D C-terminal domain-containing protein [Methylobacter sp.]MDP2428435.1 exonuclease SbcCD subunit D C-terminal domain-containing protein [Methylobacter sp.]MDP3054115.1 exonuclease SbcCD subunit D C-terminal domain-containing protein [Methylobacter sp.]MDP3362812.1 exonuclease SbcCD subunit D C-terminal domain-containing protein [Methylobacter sp.]
MLRLFHSADWHLGHHLHGISRQREHQQFLDWLLDELDTKQADALIVAGDIFDSANPSSAAQAQLYNFLVSAKSRLPNLDIVLVGGNHDSASRLDAPASILNALGVTVVGGLSRDAQGAIDWERLLVPLTNTDGEIKAWCGAMPFLRNADLPTEPDSDPLIAGMKSLYAELFAQLQQKAGNAESLILTGHCYMVNGALSELSERKILGGNQHALPVELFPDDIAYVALGHLHLAQKVGANEHIRYSGSPIPLSFDEVAYTHQIMQIDLKAGQPLVTAPVKIPRSVELLRIPNGKDFAVLAEVIGQLEQLTLDELPLEQRPLLELRIRLEKPEPGLRQQIEQAIAALPVRLLKISTAYNGSENSLADLNIEERLEELQPLDVFQRCYQNKYDKDAPDAMTALFNELFESLQGTD